MANTAPFNLCDICRPAVPASWLPSARSSWRTDETMYVIGVEDLAAIPHGQLEESLIDAMQRFIGDVGKG